MGDSVPQRRRPLHQVAMSSAMVVAFGPNNSFFLSCGGTLIHHDCPAFLQHWVTQMAQPYKVILGPGTGDYSCTYQGTDYTRHSSIDFSWTPHLKTLKERLNTLTDKNLLPYTAIGCAVGSLDQYVLTTPTSHEFDGPISASLKTALTSRTKQTSSGKFLFYPDHVSLGVDDTWFIRWHDGYSAWELGKSSMYATLQQLLGHQNSKDSPENVRRNIDYLVLDPWNADRWFCVMDRGTRVEFSLLKKISDQVRPVIDAHLQETVTVSTVTDVQAQTPQVNNEGQIQPDAAPPAYR